MNKAAFDNTFNAMVTLQQQADRMTEALLEQATWMPEEGKKVLNDWKGSFKSGQDNFKKVTDEQYAKVEKYLETL